MFLKVLNLKNDLNLGIVYISFIGFIWLGSIFLAQLLSNSINNQYGSDYFVSNRKFKILCPLLRLSQSPKLKIPQLPNGWLWFNYNSNCYYNSNLMQCNSILKWPQTASERPQFCIRRRRVLLAWENSLILRPSIVF